MVVAEGREGVRKATEGENENRGNITSRQKKLSHLLKTPADGLGERTAR